MKTKHLSDDDLDLSILGSTCILVNPCHQEKQGILEDFNINVRLPTKTKMLKFVCNYDINVKMKKATLDLNKKFIKQVARWFVGFYTLLQILKEAKKLILKNHY